MLGLPYRLIILAPLKMNVLSVVVDAIATISAILHLAWRGLHL